MLLEQGAALTLGHTAPHAEFDAVVEGIGTAFGDHRAVPADDGRLTLGGTADEQFIRISLATTGLGNPGDSRLRFGLSNAVDRRVGDSNCPVSYWLSTCHQ